MILISAAVLSATLLASPQAPDQRAEAERMARSGDYATALRQFQALAAANPDDIEARLWIARLHAQMGHPEHAADVYRSILASEPQHVDALIGVGRALVTLGRLRDATDALNRAEALAPDRPAVLAAQGALHRAANHTTLALAYYLRAVALDPTNADVRAELDALRAARAHRVQLDYDFQHLDAEVDDVHAGTVEVNARVTDALRVVARGQVQRGFGFDEQRAGAGFEWSITRHAWLRAGALFGVDAVYLPDSDGFVEASIARGHARWSARVQRAGFKNADLWIGGPQLAVTFPGDLEVSVGYLRGRVTPVIGRDITTDTIAIHAGGPASSRLYLGAGYTHGIDRLDWLTLDRIGFESDTFSVKASLAVTPFAAVEAGYDFQSRPGDLQAHRARAGLIYRF